jgi:hypothetical protein
MTYQDKLGVYRVGDLKFYNKLEAIEMHSKTGIHPHWDFNEAVFDSYNWTVEPTENILELYRLRAEQLRSSYDYIVLMYSGGADSETVLQSFFSNDININEIVSYINYNAAGHCADFCNSETVQVAVPRIEQIRSKWPWIKHTMLDLSEITMNHFENPLLKFDWIYNTNMCFTPNCVARGSLANKMPGWMDIINSGKKLCVLWGHDKPRICHENNRYSVRFIDIIDNGPTVNSMAGQQPYTDELFFWTPDFPKILIKQAHLIKNYLETQLESSAWISTQRSNLAYRTKHGTQYWLTNHGVHQIIYPNWNIDTFSAGKPSSIFFSLRDSWFIDLNNSYQAKHVWQMGIEKLWELVPDYWKNDPSDCSKGLKGCWSKDYYLE